MHLVYKSKSMKTYFTFISVLILCVLSLSSCQQPKEIKIHDILSETMSSIDSAHLYYLYHFNPPGQPQKALQPRMDLAFCTKFYENNEEIQLAFEELLQTQPNSYEWAYFDGDTIPEINYDKLRNYHYFDCDTLKSHFYEQIERKGYFGILQFVRPVRFIKNNEEFFICGLRYNLHTRYCLFKQGKDNLFLVGQKSYGVNVLH